MIYARGRKEDEMMDRKAKNRSSGGNEQRTRRRDGGRRAADSKAVVDTAVLMATDQPTVWVQATVPRSKLPTDSVLQEEGGKRRRGL